MKLKYFVILLLILLLAFTVLQMMKFESSLRRERNVTLFVEDDRQPLITVFSDEELFEAAASADYFFMAEDDYFSRRGIQYYEGEKRYYWEDIFLKGVNLGVALPGRFPAEFAVTFEQYLDWFRLIGRMNANVIRTYTILPPVFYQAFSYYNFHHADRPLYLMQGVWAEVPGDENYFNPLFVREFQKEIIDAVDVIHGRAVLAERPGKASGVYASDVSEYTIAWLLGREWEPASVHKTNQMNTVRQYRGDFICMNGGNAMEAWLAEMLDFTVRYETQVYSFQHPVSFVNWLPLDPMFHSTEIIESSKVREYDNDLESIDFSRFHTTGLFPPGIFAAYHVYPYYPDFIYLQSSYLAPGPDGQPDPYRAYLSELKGSVPGMPLVIAEYGLPSSRGNSHYSPYGMHQGGHSEADQARLSLELTEDIVQTTCAGAIYFEWIDEWFKHNWLVMDFEQPTDNRKLWHNAENPEQHFGILALEHKVKTIDGRTDDWDIKNSRDERITVMTDADATYFYLCLIVPELNLDRHNLCISLDTYDEEKGDHRLPFTDETFDLGFEFLLEFISPDTAAILVDEPYSVYSDIYNDFIPGFASEPNDNGSFLRQRMLTNRGRTSLMGEHTDSVTVDRSPLRFGLSADPATSNADWYFDPTTGVLEARLDWHLLNVTDPSNRFVLDNLPGTAAIEYAKSEAFRLFVFLLDQNDRVLIKYPGSSPYSATWDEWAMPVYTSRLKPLYYTLKEYFATLQPAEGGKYPAQQESFSITKFAGGKDAAVSISFDNAGYTQYLHAWPLLVKYGLSATFGIDPSELDDVPGMVARDDDGPLKRLGLREVRELAASNEIACQSGEGRPVDPGALRMLAAKTNSVIQTLHAGRGEQPPSPPGSVVFIRSKPEAGMLRSSFSGISYTVLCAGMPVTRLDSLLNDLEGQWSILVYHHLFEQPSEIPHQVSPVTAAQLFIPRSEMEWQLRLARNRNAWIAPEGDVFRYLKERKAASIRTERFENMIFLRITQPLDTNVFDYPLTVEYRTNAGIIRVRGSENDGIYTNRNGSVMFNVKPGNEVTIEILD